MLFALISLLAVAAVSAELGPPAPYIVGPPAESRMVGGTVTDISLVPWHAAILRQHEGNLQMFCGGTILSSFHILTASICTGYSQAIPPRWVRVGSSFFNSGGILVQAARALNHPQSHPGVSLDHNIGILFLSSGISIGGGNVATVPLPNPASSLADGTVMRIAGWGVVTPCPDEFSKSTSSNQQLQRVDVPVINWTLCHNRYEELRKHYYPELQQVEITSNMFCVGLLGVGGKGACHEDAGSPVVAGGVVFGLVSWSYGCAEAYWPSVNVFIPPFTNWIVDNAN